MTMPLSPFTIARLPRIEFGEGRFTDTATTLAGYGRRALLVTGARSFCASPNWEALTGQLTALGVDHEHLRIEDEPSPEVVDSAVARWRCAGIDVVAGIGGGSALDAAKAIAGLLRLDQPVGDFLEGVGPELPYPGPAVPFVAVPTTAGTGSEATKNAVLSRPGPGGYKKSFRDDRLVAEVAIVDPDLLASCPPRVIAANGMDALTQLLESYLSLRANPPCDTLNLAGLRAARDGLLPLFQSGGANAEARRQMAYASLLSGINLAQTGLGSVHGLAAPLGALFPIPHGVACGTLVAAATRANIAALRVRDPSGPALARYAEVAELLLEQPFASPAVAADALVALLEGWTEALGLERLSAYGVDEAAIDTLVAQARGSSMRTNPVVLSDAEIRAVLVERL